MTDGNPTRRAFGYTALGAAVYFGLLAGLMEALRAAEVDLAQNGFLVLFALIAVFGVPFFLGWFVTDKTGVTSPRPIALGALLGAAIVWALPVIVSVVFDPEAGAQTIIVAAILAAIVGWCSAVGAGLGAWYYLRENPPSAD